jgi:hypothetical protein
MANKENVATKKHRKCVKGADISRQQRATTEAAARRTCKCDNVKRRTRHSKQGTTMANEEQPIVSREQEQNIRAEKVTARSIEQWKKGLEQRGDMREQGLV